MRKFFKRLVRACTYKPYVYQAEKYKDTFLIQQNELRVTASCLPEKIFVFWTGDNEMSENRRQGIETLRVMTGVEVCLVTPDNLEQYILPDFPLHSAYPYLSLVHKSDYLRCYFMNFYGGGYSDVKSCQYSWLESFQLLRSNNDKYIIGYPEKSVGGVAQVGGVLQDDLNEHYDSIIGNGAYICYSNTAFTNDWYAELLKRMDFYADQLKKHPGNILGDNEGYPIAWSEILGNIFHPLCLKYHANIIRNARLRPVLHNYR